MIAENSKKSCLVTFFVLFLGLSMSQAAIRDVSAYGAVGNGTTDDTTAINRAIAALEGIGGRRSQNGKISEKAPTAQISTKRRRGLSAAGRRRISEAMKKRWAERRSKVTPLRKSAKAA